MFYRKLGFEKIYREDPRFKHIIIDIGHFEVIKVTSNPKYWSSEDVYNYISNDPYCKKLGQNMISLVNNFIIIKCVFI